MRYRYHWLFKLLALVLAVISGAVLVLGAVGLVMGDLGYYDNARQSQLYTDVHSYCRRAAEAVFDRWAWKDTGIEPKLFERFFRWGADVDAVEKLEHEFYYIIRDARNQTILDSNCPAGLDWNWNWEDRYDVRRGTVTEMPKAAYYPNYGEFTAPMEGMIYADLTGVPLPPLAEGVTATEYYVVSEDSSVNWQNISRESYHHTEANGADYTIYRMEYTGYESYYVEIRMTAEQVAGMVDQSFVEEFIPVQLAKYSELFGPMIIWGGLCLLMSVLWLALTAGGSPKREDIRPGGLNKLPLDLYLGLVIVGAILLALVVITLMDSMIYNSAWGNYGDSLGMERFWLQVAAMGLCGAGMGGLAALLLMAVAAQMKAGDGYWLKHTCVGLLWRYGWKYGKLAALWCWTGLKKLGRWVARMFRGIGKVCKRFAEQLPLTWQWLIAGGVLWALMLYCCFMGTWNWEPWLIILGVLVTIPVVLYGAYCFGRLRDAAKKMSGGNLEEKLEDRWLLGCFGEFAGHLNALGDTCIEAARQQMKSERMKSELVTNVSHDIKTPLTSIINYVDLLQKTEDEGERREYLQVLDRQSQRLKKLIEDLMEMSRASSGNVAVEITPTDVCEAVNQALGEFADNLERCGLTVMLKTPAEPCMALCDGRHLWRVLGNALSNVVKYAMPGTRVYVDVVKRGQKVEVSLKNISANMLNITAEELMERFVRGDASRNTEGNGLGLNIAKSLMELQGGRLDLMVDGDLFKVILTLNAAGE